MKSLANPVMMKEINTNIIRKELRIVREATTQQLSAATGLSVVTVGSILRQLVEGKEVYEAELIPSNGGRPARLFCYNPSNKMMLILYVYIKDSREMIFCEVLDSFGEAAERQEMYMDDISLDSFEPLIDRMLKKYSAICAIGFGLPGVEDNHVMVINDFEGLANTSFSKHYRERYQLPVAIENDVNLAALGYYHRCTVKESPIVYIYFPQKYTPGAGICMDGTLLKGVHSLVGELQFLPIGVDWTALDYLDTDAVSKAISKVVLSFSCTVSPARVILYGEFMTDAHIEAVSNLCREAMGDLLAPQIVLTKEFDQDFKYGLKVLTMELLQKNYE